MICCPKCGEIKKDDIYGVDQDELDEAYHQGELSTEQYERAL